MIRTDEKEKTAERLEKKIYSSLIKSMMKQYFFLLIISILCFTCSSKEQNATPLVQEFEFVKNTPLQDSIIKEHLENGAWKKGMYSQGWQEEIDKGLSKDSTIAYLWQQKAMPLFKQGKYELGMQYVDKAVKYNRSSWQEYRAFIKCIFAKRYQEAIDDFADCKKRFGNSYVMDHSYDFYIGISKLQLNQFKEAEAILEADINRQAEKQGADWVHHLDLFYLGIAKYELNKYEEAVSILDRAIKAYPKFSDAIYYKALSLARIDRREEAKPLLEQAKNYGIQGYTINEDNVIYERYPYQVRWHNWD